METKNCPFCGKEIKAVAIKCKYCGKFLNDASENEKVEVTNKDFNNKTNSKNTSNKTCVRVFLFLSLLLLFVVGLCFGIYKYEDESTRNTIYRHLNISPEESNLTYKTILDKVKAEEKKIQKFLSEVHLQQNKDKIFLLFYENLLYYIEVFNYINWSSEYEQSISIFNPIIKNGDTYLFGDNYEMQIIPIKSDEKDYNGSYSIKAVKLTKPKVPFIKMVNAGEGFFNAEPNFEYIQNTYSKYLSKPLKEYLTIKQKEESDLNGVTYYADAFITVSKFTLIEWIRLWQDFREKYPKFKPDDIDKILNTYTADFIAGTDNSYGLTFDYTDQKLLPEAKKAYEEFLKKINPNTKEYKAVSKCYEILKKHNYKDNNELWACRNEWEAE